MSLALTASVARTKITPVALRTTQRSRTSDVPPSSPRTRMILSTGERVGESLVLTAEIGRGAMGSVWRARHAALGVDVAVKFLDGAGSSRETGERFRVEGMVLARVSSLSNHIVRVLDAGHFGEIPYLVMELVEGQSLDCLIDAGALPLEKTATILDRLAEALDTVHAAGFVHRDVKPANVLVSEHAEVVKLADFGVVKVVDPLSFGTRATGGSPLIGSPAYLAPGQLSGEGATAAQDVWALAVTTYEMMTGSLPFEGSTLTGLAVSICSSRYVPPSWLGYSKAFDAVFARAFALEPAMRFTRASELARAFRLALHSGLDAPSAVEAPASEATLSRAPRPRRHWDTPFVVIAVAILAVCAAFGVGLREVSARSEHPDAADPLAAPALDTSSDVGLAYRAHPAGTPAAERELSVKKKHAPKERRDEDAVAPVRHAVVKAEVF